MKKFLLVLTVLFECTFGLFAKGMFTEVEPLVKDGFTYHASYRGGEKLFLV